MNWLCLLYIISFVAGSIIGLLLSYKKYRLPFVTAKIDPIALIIAIIGWILLVDNRIFPSPKISITIGFFMVAMVMGMRPGYGRYETLLGVIVSILAWLATSWVI